MLILMPTGTMGNSGVILCSNTTLVVTQLPLTAPLVSSGLSTMGLVSDKKEGKRRGGWAGSYFSKGCSHISWGDCLDLDLVCILRRKVVKFTNADGMGRDLL